MFEKPTGPSARHFKHGLAHTRIDNIYKAMVSRCYKKTNNRYSVYGGRGICVCNEWLTDKQSFFIWAFENGYKDNLTLDRIDSNGDYEPSNCRWITQKEQQNNRRNNVRIEINGIVKTLSEWAEVINVRYDTLRAHQRRGNTKEYIMERL